MNRDYQSPNVKDLGAGAGVIVLFIVEVYQMLRRAMV